MYGHIYAKEFIEELKTHYENGMLLKDIAQMYHCDKRALSKHLKAAGVEIPRRIDRNSIIDKKFGMITVLSYDKEKDGYNCKCDCGNDYFMPFEMRGYYIRGRNKSCGCYRAMETHGLSYKSPVWQVWKNMRRRCYDVKNKRFKHYGGKGITVCDEWQDFKNFHDWAMNNGYQKGLTLDRINNDGNYEPNNCRWVDAYVQANNQSRNHKITYNGETLTLSQWTRKLNFPLHLIWKRLNRGWSTQEALTTPVGARRL